MKSLVALTVSILKDAACRYDIDPTKDIENILRRYGQEGEPFLTITLDAYRVAFEAALEAGTWDSVSIPGFRKDGRLPAFLRGFVSRVFQRNGQIRQDADWTAVRCIRQILGLTAKMYAECKPEYTAKAYKQYITVDATAVSEATADLKAVFADLFDPVLRDVLEDIDTWSVVVKHGDGASQEKVPPNSRWNFTHWEEECEPFFPSRLYAYVNSAHKDADLADLCTAEVAPTRVTHVPKTAKGPRIIAVEPSWRMFIQQGLWRSLKKSIERHGLPPRFSDSSLNRDLARQGSIDGSAATIDLSSASDSVSAKLVWQLLSGRPDVRDALFACRTPQAMLPDGTTHVLNKFASMGSATCFPIESMVFAAIAVLAIAPRTRSGRVSLPVDRNVVGRVTVYGDDIIVPATAYLDVVSMLEAYGFRVNVKKSFHKGRFRESCGGDYFDGHDVSYVKVRHPLRFDTTSAVETTSTVSLRNALAVTGFYPMTVRWLDRMLLSSLRLFPYGTSRSPGLVRTHTPEGVCATPHVGRMNQRLFVAEQKAFVEIPQFMSDVLDGWAGLHKSLRLAERREGPLFDPPSYEVAGRAVRVRLSARWLPVG